MPSTSTITTFYEFTPQTVIKSSYVNANFQNFRGNILPINTDSASSSNLSHDLGASDHYWKSSYIQEHFQKEITTGSTPVANCFNSYFKSDGKKYKKNSSGTERSFLDTDLVLAKGDLLVGLGANTLTALTIGSNSYVLTADSNTATGMAWKANAGNPLTTKGDLFCFDTAAARLPVGTDGQFLIADSASSTGIKWSGMLPVSKGGTGANNASDAINNLLPSQATAAGKALVSNGTKPSWLTTLDSSSWTPAGSSGSNINTDTTIYYSGYYLRVGNVVTCAGFINPVLTANNALISFRISLPVTVNNFSSSIQAAGGVFADATGKSDGSASGSVSAVNGTKLVLLTWYNDAGATTTNLRYMFSYTIV